WYRESPDLLVPLQPDSPVQENDPPALNPGVVRVVFNAAGNLVHPTQENALKFELFIFDALPLAERWTVVETSRKEEFAPLKNAAGEDSPETVRQALSNLATEWLEKARIRVARGPDGNATVPIEVSPLYALDAQELAAKVDKGLKITGPLCLS
ncbi:MAG: hypothetical protein ACJ8FY_04935, partial [Gemmataceae bacterium]